VAIAASDDDTRPVLKCICVAYGLKGGYSVAAADGHRLAYTHRVPACEDHRSLLLAEDLKMLSLLASGALSISLKGNSMTIGAEVYYCCHIEGSCPNYGLLLNRLGNLSINLGCIKDLIKKVKTLNKRDIVSVSIAKNTINFTSGGTVFTHAANNEGLRLDQTIRLDRDYLIDGLNICCGYFYYEDSKSPLIFAGLEVNHMVMPIRDK
jgi:DNA polymerase III sliding clamp (beta) subunit (PCNA family)